MGGGCGGRYNGCNCISPIRLISRVPSALLRKRRPSSPDPGLPPARVNTVSSRPVRPLWRRWPGRRQ